MFMALMTPDDKMIIRMLHAPINVNNEYANALETRIKQIETFTLNERMVYYILDQIYKTTDWYPYVKKFKKSCSGWVACYAIHSKW